MQSVEHVKKAFHEASIAGEKLLSQGKITWNDYEAKMLGYEAQLKSMRVSL